MGSSSSQEVGGGKDQDKERTKAGSSPQKPASTPAAKSKEKPQIPVGPDHELSTKMQGQIAVSGRYHKLPKKLTDDYVTTKEVLGSGFNGDVYKAMRKASTVTDKYAVKEFKLRGLAAKKKDELEQECEIFLSMDHPHVARLVDVYDEKDRITLVMECMEGGELFDRVIAKKQFSEQDSLQAANQMLLAINYLHSHGIVHRDIKLENWLYESNETDHLKLIDFGFSKNWDPNIKMHMSCGTLSYVAPEVLAKSYTSQCDMWSLGVVIFILLAGYMPFSGSDDKQVRCIKEGKFTWKPEKWNPVSVNGREFVSSLLQVDQLKRLTAPQALQHPWMKECDPSQAKGRTSINQDMVNSMLNYAQESKFRRHCMLAMAWSLSNSERAKLRDAFIEMDQNRCGTITLGEFKRVIEEFYHFSDDQVIQMFNSIDAAHNGEIQYSEFLAAMVHARVNLYDDFLQTAFNRFDTDSSGFLSKENLQEVLGSEVTGADLDKIMLEVDENHDGKISFEEFKDYIRNTNDHSNEKAGFLDRCIDAGSPSGRGEAGDDSPSRVGDRRPSLTPKSRPGGISLIEPVTNTSI